MKILLFIESIKSRGRERQFVELLSYLISKGGYNLHVVTMSNELHYDKFLQLGISHENVPRIWKKKDPPPFYKFYKICKEFGPDIVHVWGNLVAIYCIPI